MLKSFFSILCAYGISFVVGTIVFIGLFHTGLFSSVSVFFYRGIVYLLISSIVAALVMLGIGRLRKYFDVGLRDCVSVSGMFIGITLGWFILIPVTVERSVSVYMLSYMANTGRPVTEEQFGRIFYDNYIIGLGAFEKRFAEQCASGNIKKTDGGWVLTDNGAKVVKFFRMSSELFDTDRRLVNAGVGSVK